MLSQQLTASCLWHLLLAGVRADGNDKSEPNLEFIAPTKVYVVVGGETILLDLMQLPALTPRQMSLLAKHGPNGEYAGEMVLIRRRWNLPTWQHNTVLSAEAH